jgi:hypothetical protein
MKCQKCESDRVLSVSGKCSDLCSAQFKGKEKDGYMPQVRGVGGGDYIDPTICLECGQAQGTWPQPDPEGFEGEED